MFAGRRRRRGAARIHEVWLWVDANGHEIPGAAAWADRVFDGEVEIPFKVHGVASTRGANDINFFFTFRDTTDRDLRSSALERAEGRYLDDPSECLSAT